MAGSKLWLVRHSLAILLFLPILFTAPPARADEIRTDANIVTALDISGSIEPREAQMQIDGIAMAIRSPQIVTAIQRGRFGRIGFAVFVWADHNYPVLVSWRVISSAADALETSREVGSQLRAILGSDVAAEVGMLTDLSGALDYGGAMLGSAPFVTDHRILNIVGNGIDNVGEGAAPARNRLVAQGITINGVALGYDRTIYEYYHREVIGGPTAFVLAAHDPGALTDVLARKFSLEIALNLDAIDLAHKLR
jgi:hypothetical protein